MLLLPLFVLLLLLWLDKVEEEEHDDEEEDDAVESNETFLNFLKVRQEDEDEHEECGLVRPDVEDYLRERSAYYIKRKHWQSMKDWSIGFGECFASTGATHN